MKIYLLMPLLLLSMSIAIAADENLYVYDSLEIQLDINGKFTFVPESSSAKVREASAELLLYPHSYFRQQIININTRGGTVQDNTIRYIWDDETLGTKTFGYTADIKTQNERVEVRRTLPFPIESIAGYEQYTLPSKTIDSDHPAIITQATALAEGEDDLFKVAFKLASWVEENVQYDLTTLTATTSQKASWVLQNKEGVCDEMTSLFIAMARSLGIPARFVSGISYTTSDLFAEPWQPHGWAEVYFPDIGWVSFDITFGEYGYIDVTHIKLRDGIDPTEPATRYEWLAEEVTLDAQNLDFKAVVTDLGTVLPDEITLEQELLAAEVDFGSYNLIKGIVKNNEEYYTATRLELAVPHEIEILGRDRRTLVLKPGESKETFWVIKVPSDLDPDYKYTFPVIVYSEKNVSIRGELTAQRGKTSYSQEEIEQLVMNDEEKTYSQQVSLSCTYPGEMLVTQTVTATCTIHNSGNTNLENLRFCVEKSCHTINLPINQKKNNTIVLSTLTAGRHRIIASAENEVIEKKRSFEYLVFDEPALATKVDYPSIVAYGDTLELQIRVNRTSFSSPRNVTVLVQGLGMETVWKIPELLNQDQTTFDFDGTTISKNNQVVIRTTWKDRTGKAYSEQQQILIRGEAHSLGERLKMFWNGVRQWFS